MGDKSVMSLLLRTHNKQKQIYTKLHDHYGESHLAMHWTNRKIQVQRFEVLAQIDDLNGKSVLDIGCGQADFYKWFQEKKIDVKYTGYDIVDSFIERNKKMYPDAKFECQDILLFRPKEKFDYVVTSGIFAFGDKLFFEEMVRRCFRLATKGFGFNIYIPEDKGFFKLTGPQALQYCQTLGPKELVLKDDYLDDDFTIFMYQK